MGFHRELLASLSFLGVAIWTPALAQVPSGPGFGFYNPATGAAQPAPLGVPPAVKSEAIDPAATVQRRGRVVFEMTIAVLTNIGASTEPTCQANLQHRGAGFFSYSDTNTATSDRTGGTATCRVVINYRWPQASTTSPVIASIAIFAGPRSLFHTVREFNLPADGATTTINVNTTL